MSELLTTIQEDICSVFNYTRTEKNDGAEPSLCRIIRRIIAPHSRNNILLPYFAEELILPLLEVKGTLELVCLDPKRQYRCKKEESHRIRFLESDLRLFRAKADFDLVFCSLSHVEGGTDKFVEDLCYCRMLLKPGGRVFIFVANEGGDAGLEMFKARRRTVAAEMLLQAGLSNITEHRLSSGLSLCSGQRPSFTF